MIREIDVIKSPKDTTKVPKKKANKKTILTLSDCLVGLLNCSFEC